MRKLLALLIAALLGAAALAANHAPMGIEERAVRLHAARAVDADPRWLAGQPIEVQALLADFAADPVLVLKAQAALHLHPRLAPRILMMYGQDPGFAEILQTYGDSVLLPVAYFVDNEVRALNWARALWPRGGERRPPSAEERGWQAIEYIRSEGHGFLGQFMLDTDGQVRWLQTERVLEGLNEFFAGGIRRLEARYLAGEPIEAADLGWAAVDAIAVVGAVQLLRIGKFAAAGARSGNAASKASRLAVRLARAGQLGAQTASRLKWPALLAAGWLALRNPALLGDVFTTVGDWFGLSPRLAALAGWTLVLLVALYAVSWLLRPLAWLAATLLRAALALLAWLEGRSMPGRRSAVSTRAGRRGRA